MSGQKIDPISVKMPEELLTAHLTIIQRLMKRMGVMRVDLTDKDDPGDNEQVKISYNARKGILTIERVPQ